MPTLTPVKACTIKPTHLRSLLRCTLHISDETPHNIIEENIEVILVSGYVLERNRIRRIAQENLLVHVQAYTHNSIQDAFALQRILYQDAGHLEVLPIYIIGPLDRYAVGEPGAYCCNHAVRNSKGNGLRYIKLLPDFQVARMSQYAEQQVPARL